MPQVPDKVVPDSLNGLFWGVTVSIVLFGINIVQVWIYMNTNEDKWPLQFFVAVLFVFDATHMALCNKIVHYFFVENFGNASIFTKINVPLHAEIVLVSVVIFLVQAYFVCRVYTLHRSRIWIPSTMAIGAIGGFVSAMVSTNIAVKRGDISALSDTKIVSGFALGFATLTDIFTTVALSWTVSTSRTGTKRTRVLLPRLLLYIVTRGFLVTIVQIVFLITYQVQPQGLAWGVLRFCQGKVYVVTAIAMLNSRAASRLEFGDPIVTGPFVKPSPSMGRPTRAIEPQDMLLVVRKSSWTEKLATANSLHAKDSDLPDEENATSSESTV